MSSRGSRCQITLSPALPPTFVLHFIQVHNSNTCNVCVIPSTLGASPHVPVHVGSPAGVRHEGGQHNAGSFFVPQYETKQSRNKSFRHGPKKRAELVLPVCYLINIVTCRVEFENLPKRETKFKLKGQGCKHFSGEPNFSPRSMCVCSVIGGW